MKVVAILVGLMLLAGVVLADTTSGTSWTTPSSGLNSCLNKYATHNHEYDEYEMPAGIGVNAILFEINDNVNLGAEAKYDFNNEEPSIFGVVNINLFRLLKGAE